MQFCERLLRLQAWQRRRIHAAWSARACAMGWVTARQAPRTACYHGTGRCGGTASGVLSRVADGCRGAVCVLYCFLYTTRLSYLGLGDVLVLVFFGIVPVSLTYYLLYARGRAHGDLAGTCGLGGLRLVIDTLLLVNNYRDIDNDRRDERTLVVRVGPEWACRSICGRASLPRYSPPFFIRTDTIWSPCLSPCCTSLFTSAPIAR